LSEFSWDLFSSGLLLLHHLMILPSGDTHIQNDSDNCCVAALAVILILWKSLRSLSSLGKVCARINVGMLTRNICNFMSGICWKRTGHVCVFLEQAQA
jgi:hypothetical protein